MNHELQEIPKDRRSFQLAGVGLFVLVLIGWPLYSWLRTVPEVAPGWRGRYQSLATWERETEQGHVDLWVANDGVTVVKTVERLRFDPVKIKVQRALNEADELQTWDHDFEEQPSFILREQMPGVFKAYLVSERGCELDWVPVERVR
jgi:hypothetical protein